MSSRLCGLGVECASPQRRQPATLARRCHELFYLALNGAMMSVDMNNPVKPATPRKLFDLRLWVSPVWNQYDVTADGQRFLVIVPEGQQATRLTVLTNWPSLLTGR
jgi:hypothetical protein